MRYSLGVIPVCCLKNGLDHIVIVKRQVFCSSFVCKCLMIHIIHAAKFGIILHIAMPYITLFVVYYSYFRLSGHIL